MGASFGHWETEPFEKSTWLDAGSATHQRACFSINPEAKRAGQRLKGARDKGLVLDPKDRSFKARADADHSGNWKLGKSNDDEVTAKLRTGCIVARLGRPVARVASSRNLGVQLRGALSCKPRSPRQAPKLSASASVSR
jgi:hypothetical protein